MFTTRNSQHVERCARRVRGERHVLSTCTALLGSLKAGVGYNSTPLELNIPTTLSTHDVTGTHARTRALSAHPISFLFARAGVH